MKRLFTIFPSLLTQGARVQKTKVMYVVMALVMMMLAPQGVKANDGRLDASLFDEIHYNFNNAANYNITPLFESANYTGVSYSSGVKQGISLGEQDLSNLAFRFDNSNSGEHRWSYKNGGLYHYTNKGYERGAFMAILKLRAGDKVRVFYSGTLRYASPASNQENVHMIKEWYSDGDFYTKGNNPTIENNVGYIITSDGDLILRADTEANITEIVIYKAKTANFEVTRGTSQDGNPTYTCTITSKGRLPYNELAVPYVHCAFGYPTDFALIDEASYASGANLAFVYNYTMDQALKLQELAPTAGTFYAFKPTASGKITVNGGIETTPWDGHTPGEFHVYKYNLDNTPAIYGYYKTSLTVPYTFEVDANYIYYVCENVDQSPKGRLHLNSFTFENTSMDISNLGVVITLGEDETEKDITDIRGVTSTDQITATVKRVSSSIDPTDLSMTIQNGKLHLSGIAFNEGKDKAGTIIYDVATKDGTSQATIVITIPYHADYNINNTSEKDQVGTHTHGHIWNFSDPRRADSNIGNCLDKNGNVVGETTGILSIGQASNPNSQFSQELAKRDWAYAQRITGQAGGYHDPMYKNTYDMVGDNADMIWETEGLIFNTEANYSCIYNEGCVRDEGTYTSGNNTYYHNPDRYVGLMPDASGKSAFTIPGLNVGDRVEIFMGSGEASGANGCFFSISGANDVSGSGLNPQGRKIDKEYHVGGSEWDGETHGYSEYRGAYQFIKNSDNGDKMTFTLVGGSMCKIYSIRIYTGDKTYSDNVIRNANGDSYQLLNTYKTGNIGDFGIQNWYTLHYRGKGENLGTPMILATTGNLSGYRVGNDIFGSADKTQEEHLKPVTAENAAQLFYYKKQWYKNNSSALSTGHYIVLQTKVGDYGAFRMRVPCVSYDYDNNTYTTDYGDHNINVGYLEKKEYPYTWDFTDLKDYADDSNDNTDLDKELDPSYVDYRINFWSGIKNNDDDNEVIGYGANVQNNDNDSGDDIMFTYGGQLYGGEKMFDETRGLGFTPYNVSHRRNGKMQILEDGLVLADNASTSDNNMYWKMTIPEVPANAAIYVRGKSLSGTGYAYENYAVGTKTVNGKVVDDLQAFTFKKTKVEDDDDVVYAFVNTGGTRDVNLCFNMIKIEKIAVSLDPKKIGKTGFATESRERIIDHNLTEYFTGIPVKAYQGSYDNDSKPTKLILSPVRFMPATIALDESDAPGKGCILYNTAAANSNESIGKTVSVLNGGFHLFVPDMHDIDGELEGYSTMACNTSTNKIKACVPTFGVDQGEGAFGPLTGSVGSGENEEIRYILTAKPYSTAGQGSSGIEEDSRVVGFYQIDPINGAKMHGNASYLQMPKSIAPSSSGAKMSIVFFDEWEPEEVNGITTSVESIETGRQAQEGWYNLNGQKLNGVPTESGLYIVNGKKVMVK